MAEKDDGDTGEFFLRQSGHATAIFDKMSPWVFVFAEITEEFFRFDRTSVADVLVDVDGVAEVGKITAEVFISVAVFSHAVSDLEYGFDVAVVFRTPALSEYVCQL